MHFFQQEQMLKASWRAKWLHLHSLITSNIEICQEIFQGFDNVGFINNDEETIDISQLYSRFLELKNTKKNDKFLLHNTVGKEISL